MFDADHFACCYSGSDDCSRREPRPEDDDILACALEAKADVIDKDLVDLGASRESYPDLTSIARLGPDTVRGSREPTHGSHGDRPDATICFGAGRDR